MSKQQNQYVLSNLTDPLVVMKHSSSQIQAISQIQSSRVVKIKSNPNYINSEVFQQYISSQQSYSKLTKRVPKFLKKSFIQIKKKPSYIQAQKIKIQHHLEQMLIEDSQPSLKKKLSQEERFQIQGELKKVRSLKSQSSIQQSFKMFVPVMHKCQLCQNQSPETKISICRCEHKFCQICLQSYLIYNINNIADDIKCPEESCYQKFDQNCKLFKSLPQKMKKKYIKNKLWRRTLKESDIRLCPREQCQEGLIDLKVKPPICQKCGKTFCKQCELQSHQGPCEQNFQLLHQEWKRCPQCRVFIQKNEGCNHMTCKCAHQFCYICLSKWDNIHYACGNPENQQMVNLLQLPNFDMQQLQQMMMNNRLQLQNLQRQLEQFQNRREQIERETFLLGPVLRNFDEPIISDMRRCRRTVTALTFIILLPLLLTLMLTSLAMGIVIGWVFLTLSIIPFAIKYSYCPTGSDLKFIALFPIRTMSQVYRFYVKYIIRCGFNQSTQ